MILMIWVKPDRMSHQSKSFTKISFCFKSCGNRQNKMVGCHFMFIIAWKANHIWNILSLTYVSWDVIKWKYFRVTGPFCGEFTRLNKRLSKQSWRWWFETSSGSLWRHCNVIALLGLRTVKLWDGTKVSHMGLHVMQALSTLVTFWWGNPSVTTGSAFIKPDQLDPWIKDQIKIILLPTKLWTAEHFLVDPWSMDYADPVW